MLLDKRIIYKGSDQQKAFESSYKMRIENHVFTIKPVEFLKIKSLSEYISSKDSDLLYDKIGAQKNFLGYRSSDGNSLFFKIFEIDDSRLILFLSFGEIQPMLFQLQLEGAWNLNESL